jgi:lipoyl(octanoyl) transferase
MADAAAPIRSSANLVVRNLGRMAYGPALEIQRRTHAEVVAARDRGGPSLVLLLVEHDPPVITVSRRPGALRNLIATGDQLRRERIDVAETDRGGDITYHGPGQLVAYPIFDLNVLGLRLHGYMRFLEQIVIDTLAMFGIMGFRDESATGVWVRPSGGAAGAPAAKICAMGVRVSRWVSMHGFALNVATNLEHFNCIVPCGLAGRTVTSMKRELGEACPEMDRVASGVVSVFDAAITGRLAGSESPH